MAIRIAIVEDNHLIRTGFEQLVELSDELSLVASYSNSNSFTRALPNLHVDVVVMDIGLPDVSGIETVKKGKEINGNIQFMMCTVYEDDDKIFDSLCAGATGYMLKKTPPDQFIRSIIEIYNGGSPMSNLIARKVMAHFQNPRLPSGEVEKLSNREKELLEFLEKGYRYKEIADKLFISIDTVRKHIHSIYEKLQVSSRTEALNKLYPKR